MKALWYFVPKKDGSAKPTERRDTDVHTVYVTVVKAMKTKTRIQTINRGAVEVRTVPNESLMFFG